MGFDVQRRRIGVKHFLNLGLKALNHFVRALAGELFLDVIQKFLGCAHPDVGREEQLFDFFDFVFTQALSPEHVG